MEKIKELRNLTGAGISDCKKALDESGGDIEKAVEILRKKGISKASKRNDREASEGVVLVDVNGEKNEGYILQLNSETDFVARNEKFQEMAKNILELIKDKKPENLDDLFKLEINGHSLKEELETLSGTIGEKLEVKGFDILSGPTVAAYSHMDGRIGVLAALDKEGEYDLAVDIAMQAAATNPLCVNPEEVPAENIEKEKEIYKEQLLKEGKPEEMIDKILEGKINKYYDEVCLSRQEYIKEDKKKVQDILGDAKISKFIRYSLGN